MAWWSRRVLDRPRSPWAQAAIAAVAFEPLVVCVVVVFSWPPALLIALAAVPLTVVIGQRRYLRLSKQDRAVVDRSLMTGRASGQPELDELARDRLANASQNFPDRDGWRRWLPVVVIGAVPIALAIVAAMLNSPWWLLLMLCTPAMFYPAWRQSLADPGPRLLTLLADLDDSA